MDPPTRGCWDLNPGPSRPQILIKVSLPSCHCLRKVRYICSATRPTDMFALNLFIVLLPLKFGVVSSVWKFPWLISTGRIYNWKSDTDARRFIWNQEQSQNRYPSVRIWRNINAKFGMLTDNFGRQVLAWYNSSTVLWCMCCTLPWGDLLSVSQRVKIHPPITHVAPRQLFSARRCYALLATNTYCISL